MKENPLDGGNAATSAEENLERLTIMKDNNGFRSQSHYQYDYPQRDANNLSD